MHVCPFTSIGGKMLIHKHLPPILLIFSVFLFFFYCRLRHFNIILTISYLNAWGKQMENACLTYIN